MKALDLFCCAGGASDGLARAGFEVTGVDIVRRKNYPYAFVLGDALKLDELGIDLFDFDLVWASPPCQRWAVGTQRRERHPELIEPVRRLLSEHPWTVIENVPRAPLRADLTLTGLSVGLDRIERKRIFELSFFVIGPSAPQLARSEWSRGRAITITTSLCAGSHFYPRKRAGLRGRVSTAEACEVMGIDRPMTGYEVGEAVPPAYAEFIAREAIRQGCGRDAAA